MLITLFTVNTMYVGSRLGLCWVMMEERYEKFRGQVIILFRGHVSILFRGQVQINRFREQVQRTGQYLVLRTGLGQYLVQRTGFRGQVSILFRGQVQRTCKYLVQRTSLEDRFRRQVYRTGLEDRFRRQFQRTGYYLVYQRTGYYLVFLVLFFCAQEILKYNGRRLYEYNEDDFLTSIFLITS